MVREVLVEEPINALVRVLADGSVRPTSFLWRDRTRYVNHVGRQWEERQEGRTIRHYLLQTVDNNTYELCLDPSRNAWSIQRAWLRDVVA
ncbi:MAG: hypothetical protein KF832_08455 [Caldilineaceae bacterium]|nr:hypothetical protein [Caldilineaceae bacterium]